MEDSDDDVPPPPPPNAEEDTGSDDNQSKSDAVGSKRKSNDSPVEEDKDDGDDKDDKEEDGGDDDEENEDEGTRDGDGDGDGDEEEEDDEDAQRARRKKRKLEEGRSKARKKKNRQGGSRFFLDEADEAERSDEEEEDNGDGGPSEEVAGKDEQAAIDAVERRHKQNREKLTRSAEEEAQDYEKRAQQERQMRRDFNAGGSGEGMAGSSMLAQQSLLPSVSDPRIFKLKVKPGSEMVLVRAVMLKAIDVHKKGGMLKIKSAFCTAVKGVIFVEAVTESFAKEITNGLRMIYGSSFAMIPVQEMTQVLVCHVTRKPLFIGQWARMKRGPLKGDLVRIADLFEGGSRAMVQAVPRPDYAASARAEKEGKKAKAEKSVRPEQRLFDAQDASLAGSSFVFRRSHPRDSSAAPYDMWENEYYRDGFMYKEVRCDAFLEEKDPKPRLEELQMFGKRKTRQEGEEEEGEEAHYLKEIADQIESLGEEQEEVVSAFLSGDLVQVTTGELKGLIATIKTVNDATKTAVVQPYHSTTLDADIDVETASIVRYIFPGAHVKVVGGKYMGRTGRVVSVKTVDGSSVAIILTDGINTEIQSNVGNLQMSSEVTTGYGSLGGYELYDLVALSENEFAVVTVVGTEKLRVITHRGQERDLLPSELRGNRNALSRRSTGTDVQQSPLRVGDSVKVTMGLHAKQTGTIQHMMKGTLWLHSNTYLKSSGIFVSQTRSCVVAGGKTPTPMLSASYKGVLTPSPSESVQGPTGVGAGALRGGGGGRGGPQQRDSMIGKTVRITKGGHKGVLATVVDATPTHFSLELLTRMMKVVVERSKTVPAGDHRGSLTAGVRGANGERGGGGGGEGYVGIAQTPMVTSETPSLFYGADTPQYTAGADTPQYGGETPSSRTPRSGFEDSDGVWGVSARDRETAEGRQTGQGSSSSMQGTPGDSRGYNSAQHSVSSMSAQHQSTDSSAYGTGYGQQQSPALSHQSQSSRANADAGSISDRTYSTVPSHMSMSTSHEDVTCRDWAPGVVLQVKAGSSVGALAVVQQAVNETNGMIYVSFRDSQGRLTGDSSLHFDDLELAPPAKRERVLLLCGKDRGKIGQVTKVIGKELAVLLDGAEGATLVRTRHAAWLNPKQ